MADKFISFATAGGFSAAPFAIPLHFCSFHFHNVSSPAMHIKMFKKRKHTGKLGGWETGKLGNHLSLAIYCCIFIIEKFFCLGRLQLIIKMISKCFKICHIYIYSYTHISMGINALGWLCKHMYADFLEGSNECFILFHCNPFYLFVRPHRMQLFQFGINLFAN